MKDPTCALLAWALLASAAAGAAPNGTSAAAALSGITAALNGTAAAINGTTAQAPAEASGPAVRLFNTLLITFGAIFLGTITVRLGLIQPEKGDVKAMGFYTLKVAYPLVIFNTVATAELGDVDVATLVACFLAQVVVMCVTWLVTYFGYKSERSRGQQVLTATVFGSYTVSASNFAIGFPVVQAIYGPSVVVYLTANALINTIVFVSLTMVLFSVGKSLTSEGGGKESSKVHTILALAKDVLTNPLISFTIAGFLYQVVFSHTLVRKDGVLVLPTLLHDTVKLLTAPFVMSSLFLTGTSLRSVKMSTWPAVLVLMKVIVSAFLSFLLALLLVQDKKVKEQLVDFSFFYGSIPSSSAPLLFAGQFDPGAVEIISTAILIGMVVAAPVMFSSAILLTDESASTDDLARVQVITIVASLFCGAIFLTLLGVIRREWGFACPCKKLLAVYGVVLLASELLSLFFNTFVSSNLCLEFNRNSMSLPSLALGWMQSTGQLLGLAFLHERIFGVTQSHINHELGYMLAAACLGLGLIAAFATGPMTIVHICHTDVSIDWRLISRAVWAGLLLVASMALAVVGMCRKRRDKREKKASSGVNGVSEDLGMQSKWVCSVPREVLTPISVIVFLQFLVHFINVSSVLLNVHVAEMPRGTYLLMLMLETLLTHGQLVVLTLGVFLSENFTAHAAAAVPRLCPFLWSFGSGSYHGFHHVFESHTSTTVPDSMLKLLPEEGEASEDGEETQSEDSADESEDSSVPHA